MTGTYRPSASELTRAWREAARCWQEYRALRASDGAEVHRMLREGAQSAEAHYQHLCDLADVRGVGKTGGAE